jgi:DNA repair photolyase
MDRDETENNEVIARLKPTVVAGRGAPANPAGRFEKLADADDIYSTPDPDEEPDTRQIKTTLYRDTSKTIVSSNNSPDLGMDASVNPYRGCEHGCIYCFARPYHEYLGLSAGLDFETKIFVKPDAPELLRAKLESKSWEPQIVTLSGVTDCYQPIERKLKITRGCFEVLAEYKNPGTIITKNFLVTRDIDIFKRMAEYRGISVNMSITTLDGDLARVMEPRASRPSLRLKAVELLTKAGIPVNVMVAPVIPGLTDHEIPSILKNVANAGATSAAYTMVRLPYGVKDLFQGWLDEHFPDRKGKILNRIRESRGGLLNDARFGSRLRGEGFYADEIAQIFALSKKRYGLTKGFPPLSAASFRRPPRPIGDARQGSLF